MWIKIFQNDANENNPIFVAQFFFSLNKKKLETLIINKIGLLPCKYRN